MTNDVHPAAEETLAFLAEQPLHKLSVVIGVGTLVAQNQTTLYALRHLSRHGDDVLVEVLDVELLLEDVGSVGAAGETSKSSEVAAETTHGFNNEDTPFCTLG